jgi:pimeloyl-ACP methyl ester carboxylesterase
MREPLLLLPGFLCDEAVWAGQIAALADIAESRCIGWGDLDSLGAMAESVLDAAPETFSVAGHSMGGRVALEIYRRAPGRVRRIALFNTGCDLRDSGASGAREEAGRRALLAVARESGMRAMAMRWIPPMVHPDRLGDAPFVAAVAEMFERKTPDIQEAQMNALLARPDATGVVESIRCPALLLSGREDGFSTPAAHAAMAAAIPGSRLVVVPESGHMAPMERPEAVAAAMRDWLTVANR